MKKLKEKLISQLFNEKQYISSIKFLKVVVSALVSIS